MATTDSSHRAMSGVAAKHPGWYPRNAVVGPPGKPAPWAHAVHVVKQSNGALLPHYVDEYSRNLHELNQDSTDEVFMWTALQSKVSDDNNFHARYEATSKECLTQKEKMLDVNKRMTVIKSQLEDAKHKSGNLENSLVSYPPDFSDCIIDPANQKIKIVLSDVEPEKMKQLGEFIKITVTMWSTKEEMALYDKQLQDYTKELSTIC